MLMFFNAHCSPEANMLFLETPIGVGFSYSKDTSSYAGVSDEITGISHQFDWKKKLFFSQFYLCKSCWRRNKICMLNIQAQSFPFFFFLFGLSFPLLKILLSSFPVIFFS